MPPPKRGLGSQWSQLVDSARNARGEVVSQKIGRRQQKFEPLEWPLLTDAEWSTILNEIEKFEGNVRYWDTMSQRFITRKMYWGDATAEIYEIDQSTGKILRWINCKCNIIDCGLPNVSEG